MADLLAQKNILPMLIAENGEPFDDPDYLYEVKFDGERCLAYLDGRETILQNRRLLLKISGIMGFAQASWRTLYFGR